MDKWGATNQDLTLPMTQPNSYVHLRNKNHPVGYAIADRAYFPNSKVTEVTDPTHEKFRHQPNQRSQTTFVSYANQSLEMREHPLVGEGGLEPPQGFPY
jgi:hypothetical protein